ncbi:MAG: ATP-binding protein [Pseudomonadota bacterium]
MKIRLSIERDLEQIGPVGECLKQLCDLGDFPELARVELLVSELLTNVIKHSVPDDDSEHEFPVGLTVVADGDNLTLSVSEIGKPMSCDVVRSYTDTQIEMPAFDGSVFDLPESGWGVHLIKSICNDISYERLDDSNVLHLCFDLKAAA